MKKLMALIMIFFFLFGCAGYSFYSKSCQSLDEILVDINRDSIDPITGSMDELFLSMMQFTSEHFSKWEE